MDSASGSPESCISTDANMWSAVTKRVSVVPVTLMGTRGTGMPEDDDVAEEEVVVDVDVVVVVVVDVEEDDEDDPPVLVVPVVVAGLDEEQAAETAMPAVAT